VTRSVVERVPRRDDGSVGAHQGFSDRTAGGGPVTVQRGHGEGDLARAGSLALSRVWPEIDDRIPEEDRELAARVLRVPLMVAGAEDTLSELIAAAAPTAFDFLVVEGVVLKETVLAARSALELLGPGDVLAPPLTVPQQAESPAVSRYVAHGRAVLAVLDGRFTQAARRWPALATLLHDRLGRQTHRASMHLALLHQPRAEDRVISLFTELGERFGRMTPDGVVIELDLTHEVIGRLIGAQRPTVSLALTALAATGALTRSASGRWRMGVGAQAP
jgi:CRP/FNR family transcriptional regulator, cyclic AMP receptor protein